LQISQWWSVYSDKEQVAEKYSWPVRYFLTPLDQ